MVDIDKVLFKAEKRMVKTWIRNKIKASTLRREASILRREVRTLLKQWRSIEQKLSKKVAKVEKLAIVIHAEDYHVRHIRARHRISKFGLVVWFMRRFGPCPGPEAPAAPS